MDCLDTVLLKCNLNLIIIDFEKYKLNVGEGKIHMIN